MSSIAEIREVLAQIQQHLGEAYRLAGVARERVAESVAALTELGRTHPDPLVPPELARADEQLGDGLARIAETSAVLDRYTTLL